jgi:hypothetical protein
MNLPITVFEIMAEMAKENKVRSIRWAEASCIEPSRISEYKRVAKKTKAGETDSEEEREVHGHIFSLNNFFALWDGLKRLVGNKALQKGLVRQLEGRKISSTRVRIFLRLMTFSDNQLKLIDVFTDAVLHRATTGTK